VSLSYQNYVSDPCFYGNLPYLHNGLHKNDMVWSSIEIRDAMVNYLSDGMAKTMGNPLLLPKCTLYVHAEASSATSMQYVCE
jgi:hypothetical protein